MPIERIEVYLDNAVEPIQVLTQAPFKVKYDTRALPDGDHSLRMVTYYTNGSREVKEIPFKVANTPGVLVQGLDEGKEVSGNLELTLRVADPDIKPSRDRIPGMAIAGTLAVLLLLIWGFFAINKPVGNKILQEVAKPPTAEGKGPEVAAAVDEALLKKGEGVFGTNCAGCHQATGAGVAGAFPPLADNPNLSDAKHVVSTVIKGLSTGVEVKGTKYTQPMPPFGQLSDEDVAAVATYVRNSWGNKFGGVSLDEAKAAR
jgi:mono/diheme cytochrome c family protein